MNKEIIPLFIATLILSSCNKNNSSNAKLEPTCYTGKFIANNCYGTSIIQVISPEEEILQSSTFRVGPLYDTAINHALCTSLDDAYKDGKPFYFTMDSLTEIGITTAVCAWPKYAAVIKKISTVSCNQVIN